MLRTDHQRVAPPRTNSRMKPTTGIVCKKRQYCESTRKVVNGELLLSPINFRCVGVAVRCLTSRVPCCYRNQDLRGRKNKGLALKPA